MTLQYSRQVMGATHYHFLQCIYAFMTVRARSQFCTLCMPLSPLAWINIAPVLPARMHPAAPLACSMHSIQAHNLPAVGSMSRPFLFLEPSPNLAFLSTLSNYPLDLPSPAPACHLPCSLTLSGHHEDIALGRPSPI